jgi:hypothetical protein
MIGTAFDVQFNVLTYDILYFSYTLLRIVVNCPSQTINVCARLFFMGKICDSVQISIENVRASEF